MAVTACASARGSSGRCTLRDRRRISSIIRFRRVTLSITMRSRRVCPGSTLSSSSNEAEYEIADSGLRTSCAMLAVSRPIEASLSCCAWLSISLTSCMKMTLRSCTMRSARTRANRSFRWALSSRRLVQAEVAGVAGVLATSPSGLTCTKVDACSTSALESGCCVHLAKASAIGASVARSDSTSPRPPRGRFNPSIRSAAGLLVRTVPSPCTTRMPSPMSAMTSRLIDS